MARFNTWNFFNRNVQSGLTEGQFINMGSCLLCAGPPSLGVGGAAVIQSVDSDAVVGDVVYPLGLISSWAINQQMAVVPVPEAGSYKRYTVTGPSDGSLALGRTLYHGPSMLRALYAYFRADANPNVNVEPLIDDGAANLVRNPHNYINDTPGYENFWINMASSILSQPVGILLYIQDVNRESYGAVYLEQFHASVHGLASGPGQLVVSEQVQGSFARARPVKLANVIPLMSRLSNDADLDDSGVITTAGTERTISGVPRILSPTSGNI
jgi:hypothetical protein